MASETSRAHLRRKAQGKETVEGNGSSAAGAGSQGKGKRKAEVSVEEYAAKPESKAASAAKAATAKGATKDGRGQKRAKKGKDISSPSAPSGSDTIADESLPKNKTVPAELKYEPRAEGQTRFVTWNVTSMKSSEPKGMFRYIEAESPDVLILTETKVS